MRRLPLLALVLCLGLASADFLPERTDVTISDISSDGSARVHESIKFVMIGDYANSVYDSGMGTNELSFWSNSTGLKDVKFHLNPARVNIQDLRLRPQPRSKCNPIEGICHGEILLDYLALPTYRDNSSSTPIPGTGLFSVEKYKPRTNRYTLNPQALSFTTTSEGNIILDKYVYLNLELPADSVTTDINPLPGSDTIALPGHVGSLSWTDTVLVKFSLIFLVEESISQEVSDFFMGIVRGLIQAFTGPFGLPLSLLVIILIGSFMYITMERKRGEE